MISSRSDLVENEYIFMISILELHKDNIAKEYIWRMNCPAWSAQLAYDLMAKIKGGFGMGLG